MKSSQTTHELTVTTPSETEIVMTRVFDAPRSLVFDAFTKPSLIKRWLLGPDGWSMPICNVDLRAGGAFHCVWRNDADGKEFGIGGIYREVVAPERIVHTEKFDDALYPGEALITARLEEKNGSTTVTITQRYESREIRDMALKSGMEKGVAASYDRLAQILSLHS
jgi:uncharacterized protein YndB with AHSA1/START domain